MPNFNKWLPHIGAVLIMMLIAFTYYAPALGGKVLSQSDNIQSRGAQTEVRDAMEKGEDFPLWTNSMFSGMPTYQILFNKGSNLTRHVYNTLLLWQGLIPPHTATFLLMTMMYILMMALGVDWKIGLIGAVVCGLATNNVVLFEAGHSTKIITTAYIPVVIGGVILAFRGKLLIGGILVSLGMALQVLANHVQMTFYMVIVLVFLGIFEFVWAIKDKKLPQFAKAIGVIATCAVLGVLTNTAVLWTTWEYTQETQRGKKELTLPAPGQEATATNTAVKDGLDKDYIFNWSYGIDETMNLLIPNYKGGTSYEYFVQDPSSASTAAIRNLMPRVEPGQQQQVQQQLSIATKHYWGEQPFTSGPVYMGAVILFLFVLGAFVSQNRLKWWLLTAFGFSLMIAWGKNLSFFNYFLVDNVPMFNRFRSVTMILGIANIIAIILGAMGLHEIAKKGLSQDKKLKGLYIAAGITGGLSILAWIMAKMNMLDFASTMEQQGIGQQFPDLLAAIKSDRADILAKDALRSFALIGVAAGILWAFITKKTKWLITVILIGLIALIDLWLVDKRYISNDDFKEYVPVEQEVQPLPADLRIAIPDGSNEHYRVLDLASRPGMQQPNPFNNSITSYFHRSAGGYHAAKLNVYQDMITHYLGNPNSSLKLYGMLNTRYVLQNAGSSGVQPIPTNLDLGNAWFVNELEFVPGANEEMQALATLEPKDKVIIQEKYKDYFDGFNIQYDSAATIQLTEYNPDKMVYSYNAATEQLAVFSEVYYPPSKGWNVYIDNEKVEPFVKANYVVRAMRLPAGSHAIEMRFEPKSYYLGSTIGIISSVLVLLLFVGGLFYYFKSGAALETETYELDEAVVVEKKQPIRKTTSRTEKKGKKKRR